MSKFLHILGHVGIVALHLGAQYAGLVPGKYQPLALALQGAAQAALALVNHNAQTK